MLLEASVFEKYLLKLDTSWLAEGVIISFPKS